MHSDERNLRMNTSTVSQLGLDETLRHSELVPRAPRTGPLDRLAMRVALRLLVWSTRAHRTHATHARERANQLARERREAAWLRRAHDRASH